MIPAAVDSPQLDRILRGFRTDAHVRERLRAGGVLNIDRKLPCLFVHRQPPDAADAGTERLVIGEASYLISKDESERPDDIVAALAETATSEIGSFMVVEVWAGAADSRDFVIHAPTGAAAGSVGALQRGLETLRASGIDAGVRVSSTDERGPPGQPPLLSARDCWEIGCLLIGLEVPPLYRSADGAVYPVFLRRLRSLLSRVLRQAAFEFARVQTNATLESFHALGPRRFGSELADADRRLAELETSYELLLLVSPINSAEEWSRFRDGGFTRAPEFRYRLLPVDPDDLKRRLFAIDLEPIADPALAFLLRDKRDELDRQITLIAERNSDTFRFASARLYGAVDPLLLGVARDILDSVHVSRAALPPASVTAEEFAAQANAELEYYRAQFPALAAQVQIRSDLVGLMVSQGNLLISGRLALRPPRVAPLLHHEVGTHVLTWYNGSAQPLRQLATGLADYDELQEGLAVFAEYLAGGLDASRMRVLAGRVLAAHSVEHGADFMETFRLLADGHGFSRGTAFDIAERVHQCGGFTRDMIYLRGLLRLVEYIRAGGALEPLYIGKIAAKHVEIIEELRARGFLVPPPLLPRLYELPETHARIEAVRRGLPITDMITGPS
jgi:uncharacterized protein (TIGR02421 family)